jgi:signal peptidase
MKPEFQAGDIIISKKVDVNTLEVGDIITYYSNDPSQTVVTHKIVRFEEKNNKTYIVTKGINSQNEDSYLVNPANVLGLYKFSLPKAGFVFQFIRKPLGFILVIIIPLLILLVLSGIRIIKIAKAYKLEAKRVLEEKDALIEEERKKNLEILEEIRILKEQLQNGNNG